MFFQRFWLRKPWYGICMSVPMTQNKRAAARQRQAVSGGTWVTVVEDGGQLVAIVKDKLRGTVKVPLGRAQPPVSWHAC